MELTIDNFEEVLEKINNDSSKLETSLSDTWKISGRHYKDIKKVMKMHTMPGLYEPPYYGFDIKKIMSDKKFYTRLPKRILQILIQGIPNNIKK